MALHVALGGFRLASCDGLKGKPAVFITKSFDVFLGNATTEEIVVTGEIFGFNRGAFEDKLVTGGDLAVGVPLLLVLVTLTADRFCRVRLRPGCFTRLNHGR